MVSPVEGELRVRKDVELDRETTAFYNITVTAQDLGSPSRNSSVSSIMQADTQLSPYPLWEGSYKHHFCIAVPNLPVFHNSEHLELGVSFFDVLLRWWWGSLS